jgi:hypothetical protein
MLEYWVRWIEINLKFLALLWHEHSGQIPLLIAIIPIIQQSNIPMPPRRRSPIATRGKKNKT